MNFWKRLCGRGAHIGSLGHALMPMVATIRSVYCVELLTSMTKQ
jgi:hypothetical protein